MARFAVMLGVFLGSSAIGLIAAALLVDGFRVRFIGFITTVVIFAVAQSLISAWLSRVAEDRAKILAGLSGLGATVLALIVASLFGRALWISGLTAWVLGAAVVWVVSLIATLLLPRILAAVGVESARGRDHE